VAADFLTPILERKQREVARRLRHASAVRMQVPADESRIAHAVSALTRPAGALVRVIAEVKSRSPSAGVIRARTPCMVQQIVGAYATAGASAVSVLCDGPGFGGSVLDVRRAVQTIQLPVLFKEFVLDPIQVELAQRVGAHMVLLLVRALPGRSLEQMVECVLSLGLAPVVEAADGDELERALKTASPIIGVNARDLRSFNVDRGLAAQYVQRIDRGRVAIQMSGIHSREALQEASHGRADALLIGESLMRATDPGAKLAELLTP
jgi:indole-3-glycerol phosphate synthase